MIRSLIAKRLLVGAGVIVVGILILTIILNSRATQWVSGDGFREMLNKETSKGLKLQANYSPLFRTGLFSMHADSFDGTNGFKTIVAIHARDISGTFNPLGIPLHRWQLDNIHIKSGSVMLQKTDPTPGAPKGPTPMPWWGLFWPYHVYLTDVKTDDATILWKLQDKESGIYDTFLEITPNGRDFEYDARGGQLKTPMAPDLQVRHAHMLIRKPRLYCSEFILGDDDAHPEQQIRMTGDAGLQDDRSIKLKVDIKGLNVAPWMPEKLRSHVSGHATGHFDYASTGSGLETATGSGNLDISDAVLHELAPVHQYITVTGSPDPGDLVLKVCQTDIHFQEGSLSAENIKMECEGVFRLSGTIAIAKNKSLSGTLELGLTDAYLKWLPTAKTAIFTREDGPYNFTTIQLSGTTQKPQQDLTERVTKEISKSPLLALKLFFNQAGDWFNFD